MEQNHKSETEIWLVFYKKHTGRPVIPYNDAVEEALCFGWIDSILQRIDEEKYARKFTPRKLNSVWSDLNKRRVVKMAEVRRMAPAGLARITFDIDDISGKPKTRVPKKEILIPGYIEKALAEHPRAQENFNKLPPYQRRNYLGWIVSAKKEETRLRRLKEAITLLERNQKLGMK